LDRQAKRNRADGASNDTAAALGGKAEAVRGVVARARDPW